MRLGRAEEHVVDAPYLAPPGRVRRRSLEKAQALVSNFRGFIEADKDELEAIQVLSSRPYRAGLRFRQVKELVEALKRPPPSASPERVWRRNRSIWVFMLE